MASIAFDSETEHLTGAGATSCTVTHTAGGTNRIAFAGILATAGDVITGVTYDGVAMTLIDKVSDTVEECYLYYLINPSTTTNANVIASASSGGFIRMHVATYTGAKQSGVPDAHTTNSGSSVTSLTTSLTTVALNCWTVMEAIAKNSDGKVLTADTGSTLRSTSDNSAFFDSNAALAVGSNSMKIDASGTTTIAACMASFAPASVSFTKTLADSIMNAASRSATLARIAGFIRTPADSVLNGASRSATVSRLVSYFRTPSDSILNGASRTATLAKGLVRSLSDSISNAASRFATVARIIGFTRTLSDSITNAASRLATVSRIASFFRSNSASILNGAGRTATLTKGLARTMTDSFMIAKGRLIIVKAYVNGLLIQFKNKFITQGTSYSSKFNTQGTDYEQKYQ